MMLIKNMSRDDYRHLWWLLKSGFKSLLKGHFKDAAEAYFWIRIHLSYDSKTIEVKTDDRTNSH